jgi:hypothetical protein
MERKDIKGFLGQYRKEKRKFDMGESHWSEM